MSDVAADQTEIKDSGIRPGGADPNGGPATEFESVIERLERERLACRRLVSKRHRVTLWVLLATFLVPPVLFIAFAAIRYGDMIWSSELLSLFYLPLPFVFVFGLILFIWSGEPTRNFAATYKASVLPAVAQAAGGFRYEPDGRIPMERLERSTLVPPHQIYESEDLFRGAYKGVDIEVAEARLVTIEFYTDHKGRMRTRTVVVFSGLFALFSMDKRFSSRTVVRTDIGALLNWVFDGHEGLERVRLEDPTFEETFEVFSGDQIEARYLLTPAFMVRLASMASRFGHQSLQAAFYDRQLLLMIPLANDRFEPPAINVSLLEDSGVRRLARELREVLSIIDVLKLDERTGL